MRGHLPGIAREGPGFALDFAGQAITAFPGESLAAALTAAGVKALRQSGDGAPRGLWCGMGVCGECMVLVDGQPARACLTAAAPGQQVAPHPARATPAESTAGAAEQIACDVLVVGAGPAGLAAARAAHDAGADVLLIDERGQAGGQYFKQPGAGFAVDAARLDAQFAEGRALAGGYHGRHLAGITLWAAEARDDGVLAMARGADRALRIAARRIVLAMGAHERAHMVPGWTLPGVMTTGAAQTLLRAYQTLPGARVLVAGNGPLNVQVAAEITRAGGTVVALAEQAPALWTRPTLAAQLLAAGPGLALAGLAGLARLRAAGVPLLFGHVVLACHGTDRLEGVTLGRIGGDGRIVARTDLAVDALCIGAGFQPQAEVARALGVAYAPGPLGWRAVRDDDGRAAPTVFVAGDGGGLGGARAALAQGRLAGLAAARDCGHQAPDDAATRAELKAQRRFQSALWALFAPLPLAEDITTPETIVCRCESVTRGRVEALIAGGACDVGSIKRACRLGMGRCQGRYCAPWLAERLAGQPTLFAPRPPFKPMRVADIAALADPP